MNEERFVSKYGRAAQQVLHVVQERRLPHLLCPVCQDGFIFRDARGGYECNACPARYAIEQEGPRGYGGPKGNLSFFERLRLTIARLLTPE